MKIDVRSGSQSQFENRIHLYFFTSLFQLLYVVFSLMGRYLLTEVRTATGRIDVVWQSRTDVYVFELKMDKPAQKALEQIDEKGYMIPFTYDGRQLHKIGLSFSTKTRTIEEWVIAQP